LHEKEEEEGEEKLVKVATISSNKAHLFSGSRYPAEAFLLP
jgi:hypothetical protein